jgi:hypothetical protein
MESSFIHTTGALTLCLLLFVGMIILVPVGRWLGNLWRKEEGEPKGGVNSLLAAMFALFGFILAFAFGMSGSRFESVRGIIVQEANGIGTATLRADLYPDSIRNAYREDFKNYVEARIAYYDKALDTTQWDKLKEDAASIQQRLWERTMQQSKLPNMMIPTNNMVPALNAMFDIVTTRDVALKARVPDTIVWMLFVLALATSLIAGFTTTAIRHKDWIVIVTFALLSSMIVYITLDLGRPMRGVIKAEMGEQAMVDLRKMF